MSLDHSKATITISISGIALACINRQQNRCEVGILRCDRHKPVLDIQKVEMDPETGTPVRSSLVPHSLSLSDDIAISVDHAGGDGTPHCEKGVLTFTRRGFDRLDDTGDDEDFRWIPDLEGPEFHNRKLRIRHRYKLQPVIFITDGVLYSGPKTDEIFARVSVNGKPSSKPLGKLGNGLNADIMLMEGDEIVLSNRFDSGSDNSCIAPGVRLANERHIKYFITIENLCEVADESDGTDFRLFYEVLEDPEGRTFDLRRIAETGYYGAPEEPLEGRKDFSLDGAPENCFTGRLGQTQTLKGGTG
jgi:hypothetical protein